MKALLWKDCRLNRFVLILGTVLLVGPYVAGVAIRCYMTWSGLDVPPPWSNTAMVWSVFLSRP